MIHSVDDSLQHAIRTQYVFYVLYVRSIAVLVAFVAILAESRTNWPLCLDRSRDLAGRQEKDARFFILRYCQS